MWDMDWISENALKLKKKIFFHMQWENFQNCVQMHCIIIGVLRAHI